VFPNLRRTHKYGNLLLCKQLCFYFLAFFHFIEKKYFHGDTGTYKIGEVRLEKRPKVLLLGEIPQNTHRNKKRVVYGWMYMCPEKKKRQKKEKYGCIYLAMVYIHSCVV
jgi:hypothetical protein